MTRRLFFAAFLFALSGPLGAQTQEDGPPISITSPDTGTTYAYGTIKTHTLYWDKNQKMLIARVTFIDENQSTSNQNDDTHEFRLPGISLDEAKGIFTATSAKGEVIPVAHYKKVLFVKTIETSPNAAVRVLHPHGNITVILEAISPNDPAMHPPSDDSDPNGTHQLDIN